MVVTLHGASTTITELELVRVELLRQGFPQNSPPDEWIRFYLNRNATMKEIVMLANAGIR